MLSLEQLDQALSHGRRLVLEGPTGRGKTTTLIQLAQHERTAGTAFIVELTAWTSSRQGILEYIARMPSFQAEGLTAIDLARVQEKEPFLFLFNGWNEIAESDYPHADVALRELDRDFPSAGVIVATRTHHLTPPLPGALRLRLLPLRRTQRNAYLAARLGAKCDELSNLIDADPSLDELTRTPFILKEVTSLFEANAEIPSAKIGILEEVLRLQEQRDEHRNALQASPIFARQTDYLKALANEMTLRGTASLPEADARAIVATVVRELVGRGQIAPVGAPAILATLAAHHVTERLDYPQTAFQFEHQQLQEYFAALVVRARLLDLQDDDHDATVRFATNYINDPAWAEPLRMIAETIADQTGDAEIDRRNTNAGVRLVTMALDLDLVFAGELAQLFGAAVWNEVRVVVGERLRAIYAIRDNSYRQYALAAMLATGSEDFSDVIVPMLSGEGQEIRLRTYRLWPDIQVSSLGPRWREHVSCWSEDARTNFVSELLHHRVDAEIANFAAEDNSIAVKRAAVSGLIWTGSDSALTHVLESMDAKTFEDVARKNADLIPEALRSKTVAALSNFVESTEDYPARLRTALDLIDLGEPVSDDVIKDALVELPGGDMQTLGPLCIQPALEYLRDTDPEWASEWLINQIAEGVLYDYEYWLQFAATIPETLVEKYLQCLETEHLKNMSFKGMIAVIATCADVKIAERVFAMLRELRCKVDAEPGERHEFERQVMRQLEAVFHSLPDDIAAAGVLSSVTNGAPLDIKVVVELFSRAARPDLEPL